MNKENILTEINNILESVSCIAKSIECVNHKPHPYCITEKHITDKYISLDSYTIKQLEKESKGKIHCGMYGDGNGRWSNGRTVSCTIPCNLDYEDHIYDTVLFLQLTNNVSKEILTPKLQELNPIIISNKLDGLCFVDTKEKYRIL